MMLFYRDTFCLALEIPTGMQDIPSVSLFNINNINSSLMIRCLSYTRLDESQCFMVLFLA